MPSLLRMLPQCPPRIQHQPEVHHSPRRCCQRPTWKSLDTMHWPKSQQFEHATLYLLQVRCVITEKESAIAVQFQEGSESSTHRCNHVELILHCRRVPSPICIPPCHNRSVLRVCTSIWMKTQSSKVPAWQRRCRQNLTQLSPSGCFGRCKSTICAANLKNTLSYPATAMQRKQHDYLEKRKTCWPSTSMLQIRLGFPHFRQKDLKENTFCTIVESGTTGPNRLIECVLNVSILTVIEHHWTLTRSYFPLRKHRHHKMDHPRSPQSHRLSSI